MKYYIDLTNIEKISTIEIEARNEKEATTKAIEKVSDGGGFVYSNEVLISNIEYGGKT